MKAAALTLALIASAAHAQYWPQPYTVQGVPIEAAWALGYREYSGHHVHEEEARYRRRRAGNGAPGAPAAKVDPASLYARLGGGKAIGAVVDKFVEKVAADVRINARFAKVDIALFKKRLVQQVGQATGGPEKYEGKDMKTVHEGMKISDGDFDAVVEDLVGALNDLKVPDKEKGELMAKLAPMRGDIVEVKSAP
jgi:hemoglobin